MLRVVYDIIIIIIIIVIIIIIIIIYERNSVLIYSVGYIACIFQFCIEQSRNVISRAGNSCQREVQTKVR